MRSKVLSSSLLLIWLLISLTGAARADGIIVPEPPICQGGPCWDPGFPVPVDQLVVRYHHVEVTIEDQVAITRVDQVFFNPNTWQVEGDYIFPIPDEAVTSAFSLWIDGEPVAGEVLEAGEARRKYEDIVRKLLDPALLEYADRGALRARIFPIPPQGERRVELEYTQVLAAENGLVRYIYPLNTEKFSTKPLEEVIIQVEVRSGLPIRAVYSPSHTIATSRESNFHVRAGYEAREVRPDTDFALYYSIGESQAFHLLTYRDPGDISDPDGFFLAMLAPRVDADVQALPKDVLLVLDRSGSMDGDKFRQAQDALRYILRQLNPEDRFNIVTFSTGVEVYGRSMRPASEANEAMPWVDSLGAAGSTDINRALLEAASLVDAERTTYLIFMTDGLPTEGVVDSERILESFRSAAPANLRLFAFGVGYDVDTFLLDSLAQSKHGASAYILPGERLDEIISGFYAKISSPVLTDLSLDFGEMRVYDLYPDPLPDLFAGSQIILAGRYRQGGITTVTLSGRINGETQTFRFSEQEFDQGSQGAREGAASLPRLWATRKIGHLLNRVRLSGPDQETIDQIVRLSIRYGIVTPYTSYLITEPVILGAAEQERIASDQFRQMQAAPSAPAYGQAAVESAADQGAMSAAEAPVAAPPEAAQRIRIVGARTFVEDGGVWTDTSFDPDRMQPVKVAFLSDDYFALAASRPELAAAFSLGQSVVAVSEGVAYQVVAEGRQVPPLHVPSTPRTPAVEGTPEPDPSMLGCLGGLWPLVLFPLVLIGRKIR